MPPIINSHKTGKITEQTKDIFIECSGFDFEVLKKTLNILIVMFAEMGGDIYQMQLNYGKEKAITPDLTPIKMKLNPENASKLLGIQLKDNEIKQCLEKMGHNYDVKSKTAEIPAWRADVMHEVDLIEDIAIAYGYENFKPEMPSIATTGEISRIETLKKKIAEILCGLNMLEISSYHLITKDDAKLFGIKENSSIEMENSKSEFKILRPNLSMMALKTLKNNVDAEYPQRVFEIGKVFSKDIKQETGIKESERLCAAIASSNAGFTEIKQVLEYLTRMLSKNKEISMKSGEAEHFIQGRCAEIKLGENIIGYMGEIKPQLSDNLGIKAPIAVLEIDIALFL
jgi:phenylalanyl-tRNA synthetase beta chain